MKSRDTDDKRLMLRNGAPCDPLDLTLVGDRVKLVPTSGAHAVDIFREFTPEITEYMIPAPPERIEETQAFIEDSRERMASGRNVQLTILSREDEEFLGCCGLHEGAVRAPELGIWLKKGAQGKGLGREAIGLLVSWALGTLDIDYLVYPVDRRNSASRRIPEALGGAVFGERHYTGQAGNELDLILYKLEQVTG